MKGRSVPLCSTLIGLLALAAAAPELQAQLSVSLTPSVPPPSPVGTIVTWSTTVSGASPSSLWYRFRARRIGSDFRIIRDYGPASTLDWTASEHEGSYEIQVSVRNLDTGDVAVTSVTYRITSLAGGGAPVISPTANPLVFLYSAPPCPVESRMRVQFRSSDGFVQFTPYKPCRRGLSMNFYLAGLRPVTSYSVHHTVDTGFEFQDGPELTLTTPGVLAPIPSLGVLRAPSAPVPDGILLHSALFGPSFATDLSGNLLWLAPGNITFLTRPERGGFFFALVVDPKPDASRQVLREFDLTGMTVRETNAARINEQLAALGKPAIGAFHHEARGLPDGGIMVLASTEQMLPGAQGAAVDVLGDMILVLDRDLQVVWTWDAFDHLDPHRAATLGETCGPSTSGCPPLYLASRASDWVHGNSLQLTSDGNILYSSRHQDWVIKIDYSNGEGNGDVIWRLGPGGDFQINSADPNPWFSHQHDAQFAPGDETTLTVYDDGNLRQAADPNAHSRGQVLQLDEQNMVATLAVNTDLGGFSFALGAAQQLPNGDYHFGAGWLPDNTCRSLEVDSSGNLVYGMQVKAPEFRAFRMRDLYTPE